MDIYAWIGEDERGSGRVGLKQVSAPAGHIPLVVMDFDRDKITRPEFVRQLQAQASFYGKTIRLARFTYAEDLQTLKPEPRNGAGKKANP